jgi:type II secretion system protein G
MPPMKTRVNAYMSCCRGWTEVATVVTAQKLGRPALDKRGLTLVELIVVIAILGVLALMALPAFSEFRDKVKISRTVGEIRSLEKDLIAYAADNGRYPDNLAVINRNNLKDPWGHGYAYYLIPLDHTGAYKEYGGTGWLNNDFDLYSMGVDGLTDNEIVAPPAKNDSSDDIVRGGDGGVVELGSEW